MILCALGNAALVLSKKAANPASYMPCRDRRTELAGKKKGGYGRLL